MSKQYRLPSIEGFPTGFTTDAEESCNTWEAVATTFLNILGVQDRMELCAFDPDFAFFDKEANQNITFPQWFVEAVILASKKESAS